MLILIKLCVKLTYYNSTLKIVAVTIKSKTKLCWCVAFDLYLQNCKRTQMARLVSQLKLFRFSCSIFYIMTNCYTVWGRMLHPSYRNDHSMNWIQSILPFKILIIVKVVSCQLIVSLGKSLIYGVFI